MRPVAAALGIPPAVDRLYRQVYAGSGTLVDQVAESLMRSREELLAELEPMMGAGVVRVEDDVLVVASPAEALGLTPVLDDGDESVWQWCLERWQAGPADVGADVVFQCRGQAAVLATALRSVRAHGTVVDLAFYQGGAPELRLGE